MSVRTGISGNGKDAAETQLLLRIAAKDRGAFDELFNSYHRRLFSFLFRLTHSHGSAEELTNDVLLTVWKDAGRFRGESKASSWIFGIAYRKGLTHLKKRKLKLVPFVEQDAGVDDSGPRIEREDWVRQGVDALPPKQRLTVMLVYFLGLSCAETAKVSGVPLSTVKTRMFHARQKMKEHLVESRGPQERQKELGDE